MSRDTFKYLLWNKNIYNMLYNNINHINQRVKVYFWGFVFVTKLFALTHKNMRFSRQTMMEDDCSRRRNLLIYIICHHRYTVDILYGSIKYDFVSCCQCAARSMCIKYNIFTVDCRYFIYNTLVVRGVGEAEVMIKYDKVNLFLKFDV